MTMATTEASTPAAATEEMIFVQVTQVESLVYDDIVRRNGSRLFMRRADAERHIERGNACRCAVGVRDPEGMYGARLTHGRNCPFRKTAPRSAAECHCFRLIGGTIHNPGDTVRLSGVVLDAYEKASLGEEIPLEEVEVSATPTPPPVRLGDKLKQARKPPEEPTYAPGVEPRGYPTRSVAI